MDGRRSGRIAVRCVVAAAAWVGCVVDVRAVDFTFTQGSNLTALSTTNPTLHAQVLNGFQEAGNWWASLINDNVTINVTIDYPSLGTGILGSASSVSQAHSYANVRTALGNDATSSNDATAHGSLTTASSLVFQSNAGNGTVLLDNNASTNNNFLSVTRANAKALGILSGSPTSNDVTINFSSNFSWDFDRSNGITGGQYDFVGVAAHEIGHALGFRSGVDSIDTNSGAGPNSNGSASIPLQTSAVFTVLDLFRTSSSVTAGVYDWTVGGSPYFTIDGGTTNLGGFSTGRYNGDGEQASHFKDNQRLGILDPTLSSGTLAAIKALDLTALDVIGWNLQGMSSLISTATTLTATPYVMTGSGTLSISGADAALNLRNNATTLGVNNIHIGVGGQGAVTVSGTSTLTTLSQAVLASFGGSTATALVSGTNSSWATGSLYVGADGIATLTVQNGGLVSSTHATVGANSGGSGIATVTGGNARWNVSDSLMVGQVGSGTLNVQGGGRLTSSSAYVGYWTGAAGVVTVSGANSQWTANNIYLGASGMGTLAISNGGKAVAQNVELGAGESGVGFATVSGVGSQLTATGLVYVGAPYGTGTFNILAGGKVTSSQGIIAGGFDSVGMVNVSGAGSEWSLGGLLNVGHSGDGTLNITGSGAVRSFDGYVGDADTDVGGDVLISGAGSRWTLSGNLFVGSSTQIFGGGSSVTVTAGGLLDVAGVTKLRANGTLHVGNGGTFDTGLLEVVPGSTFIVDPGATYTHGNLNIAAGGYYTGNIQTNGAVVLNGTLDGNVTVQAGDTLGGSGVVQGNIAGAGLVGPGNSPGVMDAEQLDPTSGIDFLFQFTAANTMPDYLNRTASLNDVLHLTHATTPFLAALTSNNVITVDFQVGALADGDYFQGGFFTNLPGADFYGDGTVDDALFNYLLNGSPLNPAQWQVSVTTVAQSDVDFGVGFGGVVDGRVMQFNITAAAIPEPGSLALVGTLAAGAYWRRRRNAAKS